MSLEQIKIMTCGNVDDGKSTLLGKIFLDFMRYTGQLF